MKQITIEPTKGINHKVMIGERLIGHFIMDIDGYYYFDFKLENGIWTPMALRQVADLLDDINKPHDDGINEYFKKTNSMKKEEQQKEVNEKIKSIADDIANSTSKVGDTNETYDKRKKQAEEMLFNLCEMYKMANS
jgi:hypothetical protein